MAVARIPFSGSTHGRGVKVVATATAGTTIHTANNVTADGVGDFIWVQAYNSNTTNEVLTIEFGGTTAPDDNIVRTIPPSTGLVTVIDGLILRNSLVVKAFSTTANKVVLFGWVDRIT